MTQPNRETARDAITNLLNLRLVTTDAIVQAVYAYRKGDFGGLSPVVCVSSAGSERERADFSGTRQNIARFTIHVFVVYAAASWTEWQAEDRLDAIEAAIADVIDANSGEVSSHGVTYWLALDYDGASSRSDISLGGKEYIQEAIPVAALMSYG